MGMPFRPRWWAKDPIRWLRQEAETIVRFVQFRMRGYGYRVEQWENDDGIVIIINLPFPRKAVEELKKKQEMEESAEETGGKVDVDVVS